MAQGTKENHFEDDVVKSLVTQSKYIQQDTSVYDKDLCLIPDDIIAFVKDTQANAYQKLEGQYGAETDRKIVENVAKSINTNKTVQVLREGTIKDRGVKLKMAFFKPNHNRTPEHLEKYEQNRLTVIRQLK